MRFCPRFIAEYFFPRTKGSDDEDFIPATPENIAAFNCGKLKQEVKELKEKVGKIDSFILANPELVKLCSEKARSYQRVYSSFQQPLELDKNNVFDRQAILQLKIIHLTAKLHERELFFTRDPELKKCLLDLFENPQQKLIL